MPALETIEEVLELTGADTPVRPASAIKSNWSRIAEGAKRHGEVIVTNHNRPEVVVMGVAAYADLVRRAEAGNPLKLLREQFDQRFAMLNTRGGTAKLRAMARAGIPVPKSRSRKSPRNSTR